MNVYYAHFVNPVRDEAGNNYDWVIFYELPEKPAYQKADLERKIREEQASSARELPSPKDRTQHKDWAKKMGTRRLEKLNPLVEESMKITGRVTAYFLPCGTVKKGDVITAIPAGAKTMDGLEKSLTESSIRRIS